MTGDVVVVGLAAETVILDDIAIDVPHGSLVRIPEAKASNSRSLWLALSQKRLFRLMPGPVGATPPQVAAPTADSVLLARVAELEKENAQLQAELLKAREALQEKSKIDEVLALLRSGYVAQPLSGAARPAQAPGGVVEIETPTYIPSTVRVDPSTVHVAVAEEASSGGGISAAQSALRKLRRPE